MKDKKLYIVSSVIIAVSIAIVLIFIFLPQGKSPQIVPLNCSAENIEMEIGDERRNFYQVSHNDADVEFELDKTGVIEIDNDKIVALSAGRVTVTMTATLNSQSVTSQFVVTVLAEEYSMQFNVLSGGVLDGDTLKLSSNACQFYLHFYDKSGNEITGMKINITATNGALVDVSFGIYRIIANKDCIITFNVENYNYSKTLNVVV